MMPTSPLAPLRRMALAALLVLVTVAVCAALDETPTAAVHQALDKASAIAAGGTSADARLDALRGVARDFIDTRAMGRRALGPAFAKATPAQQEQFLALFTELFIRSYLQKLLLFRAPTFRYGKQEQHGETVRVITQIVAGADSYEVAYDMQQVEGRWLATDIVVEGISMTSNYSDQFASLLRTRSLDELLDLMRRKLGQPGTPAAH